ncbi:MAG TPA: riboflavin biosynthesis protein RibF [Alphaproteobacteria bacterium]|nr:riboflavin biosynthesis protein RibF [Alphaproteobacteria bacterium]HAJ46041.1 riboflavin biosynthesis protein RibF [Alphaproteobacteria bacterium]
MYRDWRQVPDVARACVIAIGNFDGVHRGHQAVLGQARRLAEARGVPLAALVFEPHPRQYFQPDAPHFRLTPLATKAWLLARYGVSVIYALPFDHDMAERSAQSFLSEVLRDGLGAKHLVVGPDFQFGKGREGTTETLTTFCEANGLGATVLAPVGEGEFAKISSTAIRELLEAGDPAAAARLMGHWWSVVGMVEKGDQRGRTIGFPTANVSLRGYLQPALGVYAVKVEIAGTLHGGVANFGRRPTFDKTDVLLEVHVFDFQGDLYGQEIVVSFVGYLRPERKFAGLEELKAQIATDAQAARELLSHSVLSTPGG